MRNFIQNSSFSIIVISLKKNLLESGFSLIFLTIEKLYRHLCTSNKRVSFEIVASCVVEGAE